MPGIFPSSASLRSMMRLTRNLRYTPRARPVSSHRRTIRELYFGVRLDFATCAFVAMSVFPYRRPQAACSFLRNGIPSSVKMNRLNSAFEFRNEMLMFIPCVNVTRVMSISGNTPCSLRPIE